MYDMIPVWNSTVDRSRVMAVMEVVIEAVIWLHLIQGCFRSDVVDGAYRIRLQPTSFSAERFVRGVSCERKVFV